MKKYHFRYMNLDRPNKNGHIYSKETIYELFNDKSLQEKMASNSLFFFADTPSIKYEADSAIEQYSDVPIGSVTLKNSYPSLDIGVTLLDEQLPPDFEMKYPCFYGNCYTTVDRAVIGSSTTTECINVSNVEIRSFFNSDTCAFDCALINIDDNYCPVDSDQG